MLLTAQPQRSHSKPSMTSTIIVIAAVGAAIVTKSMSSWTWTDNVCTAVWVGRTIPVLVFVWKTDVVLLHRPSSFLFDGEDRTESDWVLTSCLTTSALFISGLTSISSNSVLSSSIWKKPCPDARHQAYFFFFFFRDDSWWWHVLYARLPVMIAFLPLSGMTPLWGGKTSFFTSGV